MTQDGSGAQSRLLDVLARLRLPEALIHDSASIAPLPAPDQLWRLLWGSSAAVGIVREVHEDTLEMCPVTFVPDEATQSAHLLPATSNTLGMELVAWVNLTRAFPVFTLERHLGDLVPRQAGPKDWLSEPGPTGMPILGPQEPRIILEAELQDRLQDIAEASWVPQGDGTLHKALRASGVFPSELAQLLGVPLPTALGIQRGQLPVDDQMAAALGPRIGLTVTGVLARNPAPPVELQRELNKPARRAALWATRRSVNESEVVTRRRAAASVYTLAARESTAEPSGWVDRVDRYLQVAGQAP